MHSYLGMLLCFKKCAIITIEIIYLKKRFNSNKEISENYNMLKRNHKKINFHLIK